MMEEEVEKLVEILHKKSHQYMVTGGHGCIHPEPINQPLSASNLEFQLSMASNHIFTLL